MRTLLQQFAHTFLEIKWNGAQTQCKKFAHNLRELFGKFCLTIRGNFISYWARIWPLIADIQAAI